MNKRCYTVITGASRGLGKAMARECAQLGRSLILLALPNENLEEVSAELQMQYSIDVVSFELDMTDTVALAAVIHTINHRYGVDMLINNAGFGGTTGFHHAPIQYLRRMIGVNIQAMVILTHGLLENLKQHRPAFILNIASLAYFTPMPYKTTYPASKAFVYSFSRGLHAELSGSGVFVSVAHPGGMATNPEVAARIRQYPLWIQRMLLTPEQTAAICIRQVLRYDSLILPGWANKLNWLAIKFVPVWLQLNILRHILKKELNVIHH